MCCLFSIFTCQFSQFPSVVAFQFNTNLVKGHTLYDFNDFLFIEICFLTCHIIYMESSLSTLEECAFCYCWVESSIQVSQVLQVDSVLPFTINKARRDGGIPGELFQILKDDAVKVLCTICQQIWKTQQWPQDGKMSVFIPMPKKGNAKGCSNYHQLHSFYIL